MAFTYSFRDYGALAAIKSHVIPHLRNYRYIWVWDAGCAMGQGPYSLAIIFREAMGIYGFRRVKILATDLDEENGHFGRIIARGIYPEQSVKRLPQELKNKYFDKVGDGYYVVSDELKKSVLFQRHDLRSLNPIRANFGLIVCKNVRLHLNEDERIEVIKMLHQSLLPGGFFVMEHTQAMPKQLGTLFTRVVPNVQLFQKKMHVWEVVANG